MRKNFTLSTLFVFAVVIGVSLAANVSAETKGNCSSGQVINAPAIPGKVIINEVYGGSETGGVYNSDFIELYNPTSTVVNISDYSVQYYTSGQINSGAPTSTAHIPDATLLEPFSYYVIRVSPANRAGASLPCAGLDASASFAETGIASEGGKLVLSSTGADLADCTSSLNVVDRVAWGLPSSFVCNETVNAAQPSVATSVQRSAYATDTDNNNADFTAFAPPTPCGQLLAPTAAMVNISGHATNSLGNGIRNLVISMTDASGVIRMQITDSSGYYSFTDVQVGEIYVLKVISKRFTFVQPSKILNVDDDAADVNFVGNLSTSSRSLKKMRL